MNAIRTTTEKTNFSRSGHTGTVTAETYVHVNGQTWVINTQKRYSGALSSSASKVKLMKTENAVITQYDNIFKNETLVSEKLARVTEKAVKDQHLKALALFDQKIESGEISAAPVLSPEIGTIIFLDGYGKTKYSDGNKWIVYKIDNSHGSPVYHCVEQDTHEVQQKSHIKPFSEKFGIGNYWEPGYNYEGSADDLANLVIEAIEKKEADQKAEAEATAKAKSERAAKIEAGKKLVSIPEEAAAVIIAEDYEDQSDSQTDYFWTSPVRTLYLAFSTTTRNNANELKKAAARSEETAYLLTDEETDTREGYNGLPHYFVGSRSWNGWKISKERISPAIIEQIYIAAAESRYFAGEPEAATTAGISEDLKIEVVEYSEKALAIFGNTYEIKDHLKSIGAKFNRWLKYQDGTAAGWILPKSKKDLLNLPKNSTDDKK